MKTLLLIVLFALPVSLFAQTNSAAYDQLMTQAGSQIAGGNLDAAKQTAQQALQLDSQNWRGNALMAAILQKQNDFTNAQIYIQKAIAAAPDDKKDKLNGMAQTIAAGAAQGAPAPSGGMSPEARIKYDGLMVIAEDADKATTEDDRKQALREFMVKSAAFLELVPDATNIWVMRALTAVELDYPTDGWYAGRKLKALGLETSDDPKVQKAFGELDAKDWLGDNIKGRDWSKWTMDQVEAAANADDEEAQSALGDWYYDGRSGLQQDLTQALNWYLKAAQQGDAWAQFRSGWMYQNGKGATQDYTQALGWLQKSAAQGNSYAQNSLGWAYLNGKGVTQDYAQALDWSRKAAAQGNAEAQNNLGWMYQNGKGITQDYAQALDWWRKAAAQGNADAQDNLGVMYRQGWGVTQDYAQALDWYRKAAAQGNAPAQDSLGVMYGTGKGVTQDYAQALDWFQKAAALGNADAQNNLGVTYLNGWGVEKDPAQAKAWYQKAAAQGNETAKQNLEKLNQTSQ